MRAFKLFSVKPSGMMDLCPRLRNAVPVSPALTRMTPDAAPILSSASRALRRLGQSGMLIRIGEGKNTRYQLAKE